MIGATAGTFSAGFANAVLIAVETTAANSAISNKGDLGSVLKDVFSSENLQGYVLSGMLGGIGNGLGYNPTELGFDWNSAGQVILKTSADTLAQTALQGGSLGDNFVNNLLGAVIDIGGAIAANKVGNLNLVEGSPTKIAAHALVGGLKSMALGGDFKTGALAGGANEALVQYLADLILPENYDPNMPGADQAKANLLAMSQLIAVLSAVIADTDPNIAANIAATATQYNYLSHSDLERAAHDLSACGNDAACANTKYAEYHALSQKQDIEAVAQCAANSGSCEGLSRIVAEAEAKTQKLKDLAASASPEAAKMFDLLIAENHGFQNMLAGITAGHSVAAIADTLVQTLGISHEMAMAAVEGLAMSVSGMAPTIKTASNGGKGTSKGSSTEADKSGPSGSDGIKPGIIPPKGGFGPTYRPADSEQLEKILTSYYGADKTGSRVGNGGLADAVRYEKTTGDLLSPAGHEQKAIEVSKRLSDFVRIADNQPPGKYPYTQRDIDFARELIGDIENALLK
ncbi:DUF637 domain-containing protein [Pseudomonas atacamensis]|uniref:DUF637 domain-containing protein n=1 Tax=Pseudomonas atacamensis TaxID=2565368 RepID=UPI0021610050|nr:DUF637 domain-containing protein [Pseudomonas atacamensis]UVL97505.1 DUF637 domain-containing protein [Pseudomonas atacamensis]